MFQLGIAEAFSKATMPDERGLTPGQCAKFDVREIVDGDFKGNPDDYGKQYDETRMVTGIIQSLPARDKRDVEYAVVLLSRSAMK